MCEQANMTDESKGFGCSDSDGYSALQNFGTDLDQENSVVSKDLLLSLAMDTNINSQLFSTSKRSSSSSSSNQLQLLQVNRDIIELDTKPPWFLDSNEVVDRLQSAAYNSQIDFDFNSTSAEEAAPDNSHDWCINGTHSSILSQSDISPVFPLTPTDSNKEITDDENSQKVKLSPDSEVKAETTDGTVPVSLDIGEVVQSNDKTIADKIRESCQSRASVDSNKEESTEEISEPKLNSSDIKDTTQHNPAKFTLDQVTPTIGTNILKKLDYIIQEKNTLFDNFFRIKRNNQKKVCSIKREHEQISINETPRKVGERRRKPLYNYKLKKTVKNAETCEVSEKPIFKWPECPTGRRKKVNAKPKRIKEKSKRLWKNGFMLFAKKYRKAYSIAMRSGDVPRTSNLMNAVSRLWSSLSSSEKEKYSLNYLYEEEETDKPCENLSPFELPTESSNVVDIGKGNEIDNPACKEYSCKRRKISSTKAIEVNFKRRKTETDSSNYEKLMGQEIIEQTTHLDNPNDSEDMLKIFDKTPEKFISNPYEHSSRISPAVSRRKRVRKSLNFDHLLYDQRSPLCFEIPDVNVYTLLQDYDPPDDYTVPDVYDNEYLDYKWDYDEIANVKEADNSDFESPKIPSKLRTLKIIQEPELLSQQKLPISINITELLERNEPVINVTEQAFKKQGFPNQPVRLVHTPNVTLHQAKPSSSFAKSSNSRISGVKHVFTFNNFVKTAEESKNQSISTESQSTDIKENQENASKDIHTVFQLFESSKSDKYIAARPAGNIVLRLTNGNDESTVYKIPVVTSEGACKILSLLPKNKK
ncbi:DgyrCDS7673 [Dimorphilus gyrociliatus]|uniref:DgyrCDS7673 n=1 Tax=Dimorphilus gyrociliatus TaxID=2664684 RepID=A0A7I8VUC5_9ANNE|nr:DgyrCDS7673 [Dimorphilus gyrociliatus]